MKACVYTRFSPRPDASTSDSCVKQRERCEKYATERKHDIVIHYSDENVSGGELNRPAMCDLIKALEISSIPVTVIIDSPDRLARDVFVGGILRHRIEEAGGTIEFADGTPSDDTPESKLMRGIFAAFAQFERDRICFRTSRGIKRRQANGEHFGKVPIGYQRVNGKGTTLEPCEKERGAIKTARMLKKNGMSSLGIAHRLENELKDFRGGPWKARTIRRMVKKLHNWESVTGEE